MAHGPQLARTVVHGATVLTLEDPSFPLTRFVVAVRAGAVRDPPGRSGAMRIMLELLLRGTQRADRRAFNEALDVLGSGLDTAAGSEMALMRGVSLSRHLQATWELACEALVSPALREAEMQPLVDEAIDALHSDRDDDESVADIFLRRHLYAGHPLGRSAGGEAEDLSALTIDDVRAAHAALRSEDLIVAFAGDIDAARAQNLAAPLLQAFAARPAAPKVSIAPPQQPSGRRIVLVDKPDRTQVQLRLARIGLDGRHPHVDPFWLGIVAFGGTFTSPFTRQVRDVRGWSYVAHADFRRRGLYAAPVVLRSAPALGDAIACLDLELQLFADLSAGKLEPAAVDQARQYLQNRYPFEVATAFDMLGSAVSYELLGLPPTDLLHFGERLAGLDLAGVPGIVAEHLQKGDGDVMALLVAPKAAVLPALQDRFGAAQVSVVDFRDGLGLNPQA